MMNIETIIKQLIISMVSAIVDTPEAVNVECVSSENDTLIFTLTVSKEDIGKVIGKSGRNANALRVFVNACAAKHGVRSVLDIANNPKRYDMEM